MKFISEESICKSTCITQSVFPFERRDIALFTIAFISVSSEGSHPADVGVYIVFACHVHDLARIALSMLVFEFGCKSFVCLLQESIGLNVLLARRKLFRPWQFPSVSCIELGCVLVVAQVHSKGQLVLRVFARLY